MTKVFQSFLVLCFTTAALAQNPTSILQKAEAKLSGADLAAEVSIRTGTSSLGTHDGGKNMEPRLG
jgi:hypothetical protein